MRRAGRRDGGSLPGRPRGILPGDDACAANPDVLIPIATGLGEARNLIIVRSATVVIAVGGEYGTLSEIALARKIGRVVIGLYTCLQIT